MDRTRHVLVAAPVLRGTADGFPVRHPPLLSLYIAAGLKQQGFSVTVLDLYHRGRDWMEAVRRAPAAAAAVIVYREYDRPLPLESFEQTAAAISHIHAPPKLLIAGTYDAAEGKELLGRLPFVHAAFHHYPEVFLPRWLAGEAVPPVLVDKTGMETVGELPSVNLDTIPFPAWELTDIDFYSHGAAHRYRHRRHLPVIAIRGCPYHCLFCDKKAFCTSTDVHLRSPRKVVEEVRYLVQRHAIREIQFAEPLFTVDRDWVLELCDRLAKLSPRVAFSCHVRADRIDRAQLAAMARAGCWNILFGVESGDDQVRRTARKAFDTARVTQTIGWARDSGIETTASFVLGLPGDTHLTVARTIDEAVRLDPDYAQFTLHKAQVDSPVFPGDRILETWDFSPHDLPGRPYLPRAFGDVEELHALRRQAYKRFYLRPAYVARRLRGAARPEEAWRLASGLRSLLRML